MAYIKLQLKDDLETGIVGFIKIYFRKLFHNICHDILIYKTEMCEQKIIWLSRCQTS